MNPLLRGVHWPPQARDLHVLLHQAMQGWQAVRVGAGREAIARHRSEDVVTECIKGRGMVSNDCNDHIFHARTCARI